MFKPDCIYPGVKIKFFFSKAIFIYFINFFRNLVHILSSGLEFVGCFFKLLTNQHPLIKEKTVGRIASFGWSAGFEEGLSLKLKGWVNLLLTFNVHHKTN